MNKHHSIVKRPMDLSTAMKRLRGGDYPTLKELRVRYICVSVSVSYVIH